MKKIYILIMVSVLLTEQCFTQSNLIIDSLKNELSVQYQDSSRVKIMAELCGYYQSSDIDSALYYGDSAISLAHQINFLHGKAQALAAESWVMRTVGNMPKSLELGFRSLQLTRDNEFMQLSSRALNAIGACYRDLGDYSNALRYFQQSAALFDENSGNVSLAHAEMGLSSVFTELNMPDSALRYIKRAERLFQNKNILEPHVSFNFGKIEEKRGNLALALEQYRESLQVSARLNEQRISSQSLIQISGIYKMLDQTDSSLYYAKKAMAGAESISQKKTIMEAATLLAELYEATDTKESLRYYKMVTAIKDSIYGIGNIQAVETIANQEHERQNEIEAAKAKYQNQLKQYGLTGGLLAVLVIAFILFRNNQRKQKAYKLLQEQKKETDIQKETAEKTLQELKSTQSQLIHSEKMASLGELTAGIAHEIQNPLNFVNNFSEVNCELIEEQREELEKGNTEQAKSLADEIAENEKKIIHHGKRADTIVKGMLQHSRTSSGIKEPTDVNAMCDEYLRLAYHGLRAKDKSFNAKFATQFDESLPKINVVPQDIGRAILNLINNAFYAVSEKGRQNIPGYDPTVTVATKKISDKIEINVTDNGNGIPEAIKEKIFQPFFTSKPTGSGTGLGLSLSYDIVKAHGGEIKVNSKDSEGSEFVIQLPV